MLNKHDKVIESFKKLEGFRVERECSNGNKYISVIKVIDNIHKDEIVIELEYKHYIHNILSFKTGTNVYLTHRYVNEYLEEMNKGYEIRTDFLDDDIQDLVSGIISMRLYWDMVRNGEIRK